MTITKAGLKLIMKKYQRKLEEMVEDIDRIGESIDDIRTGESEEAEAFWSAQMRIQEAFETIKEALEG